MPRLWNETIEAHRQAVRDATLDRTAELVARHGLRAVTMSQIAEETGIGRATLYNYFPDVEAILRAWHQRQIDAHLQHLGTVRDRAATPVARLQAVLHAYAVISYESRRHHGSELAALMHSDAHVGHAEAQLRDMLRALVFDAVRSGDVRGDVPADELTTYCLHALAAAGALRSQAAVNRLATLVMDAIRAA